MVLILVSFSNEEEIEYSSSVKNESCGELETSSAYENETFQYILLQINFMLNNYSHCTNLY